MRAKLSTYDLFLGQLWKLTGFTLTDKKKLWQSSDSYYFKIHDNVTSSIIYIENGGKKCMSRKTRNIDGLKSEEDDLIFWEPIDTIGELAENK